MDLQRTMEEQGSERINRPIPLITATLVAYVLATAISLNVGHADEISVQASSEPTPYSADHARIANAEPQPPTF
jgi:hypothetical protein